MLLWSVQVLPLVALTKMRPFPSVLYSSPPDETGFAAAAAWARPAANGTRTTAPAVATPTSLRKLRRCMSRSPPRVVARYGLWGKTPCRAMQKFTVRYGCMLLCGWLPPVTPTALDDSGWAVAAPPGVL